MLHFQVTFCQVDPSITNLPWTLSEHKGSQPWAFEVGLTAPGARSNVPHCSRSLGTGWSWGHLVHVRSLKYFFFFFFFFFPLAHLFLICSSLILGGGSFALSISRPWWGEYIASDCVWQLCKGSSLIFNPPGSSAITRPEAAWLTFSEISSCLTLVPFIKSFVQKTKWKGVPENTMISCSSSASQLFIKGRNSFEWNIQRPAVKHKPNPKSWI